MGWNFLASALFGAFASIKGAKDQKRAINEGISQGISTIQAGTQQALSEYGKSSEEARRLYQEGADKQIAAMRETADKQAGILKGAFEESKNIYQQAMDEYAPLKGYGERALKKLEAETNWEGSPLYQWQMKQATDQINSQMAARGMYGGGAALRLQVDASQRLAAEESERQRGIMKFLAEIGSKGTDAIATIQGELARSQQNLGQGLAGIEGAASEAPVQGALTNALANNEIRRGELASQLYGNQATNIANLQNQAGGQKGQANADMWGNLAGIGMSVPLYRQGQEALRLTAPSRPTTLKNPASYSGGYFSPANLGARYAGGLNTSNNPFRLSLAGAKY